MSISLRAQHQVIVCGLSLSCDKQFKVALGRVVYLCWRARFTDMD